VERGKRRKGRRSPEREEVMGRQWGEGDQALVKEESDWKKGGGGRGGRGAGNRRGWGMWKKREGWWESKWCCGAGGGRDDRGW